MRFAKLALLLSLLMVPNAVFAQDAGIPAPTTPSSSGTSSSGTSGAIHGIDVSVYQGTIDWARVAQSGIKFAFIRASDGAHHDTCFAKNWSGAQAAGVQRGAYHYFRGAQDGTTQATDFLNIVGDGTGELPVVADVEELDGVSAQTLAAQLEKFVATVQSRTGRAPLIYTSPGLWNDWHMGTSFSSDPLWVANWAVSKPKIPTGWTDWTFWQYRSDSSVPGISGRVDADLFHGTLDELKAFGKTGAAPVLKPISINLRPPVMTPGLVGAINTVENGGTPAGTTPGASGGQVPGTVVSDDDSKNDPLLRLTAAGTNVERLQNILNANGANLSVDGDFGAKTEAAVKAFQASHGCRVDGIVGPETWAALEKTQAAATPTTPVPTVLPTATPVVKPVLPTLGGTE